MRRRWWHDLIIAVSLVIIAGIGVAAIWGPSIRAFFDPSAAGDAADRGPGPPSEPPRTGGGGML